MTADVPDAGSTGSREPFEVVERRLTDVLMRWSVASIAAGGALVVVGLATRRPAMNAFGRQTLAWGAVDGIIAGVGRLTRRRRGALTPDERAAKAKTLRTVLLANAAADVGYVAGGLVVAARDVQGRRTFGLQRGDGVAIAMQGAFLLVLDLSQAQRLASGG